MRFMVVSSFPPSGSVMEKAMAVVPFQFSTGWIFATLPWIVTSTSGPCKLVQLRLFNS